MKSMRLHLILVLVLIIALFSFGIVIDLSFAQMIYSRGNVFGEIISVFGLLLGYMVICIFGGMGLAIGIHKNYKKTYKVLLIALCPVIVGVCVYLYGGDVFGINGFNIPNLKWLGYIIDIPFMVAAAYLGYRLGKNSDNENLWIVVVIALIAIGLSLLAGTTGLKSLFHRPRYRTLSLYDDIPFYTVFVPCKNYKELMSIHSLASEEFKSFPSGHSSTSGMVAFLGMLLPLINKKFAKHQVICFYLGILWMFLTMFSRLLLGAHFLTDVTFGAFLTVLFVFIANEVIMRLKPFKNLEFSKE